MKFRLNRATAFLLYSLLFTTSVFAKLPAGFKESAAVKSLTSPVTFAFSPTGDLFIAEQTGEIRIFRHNQLNKEPFVTLEVSSEGEHGVLGLAFDPNFETNAYLYVYYTATTPILHNRISRFWVSGNRALPGGEEVLMDLDDLQGSIYHSAGALRFGPDGKLYIGVGDNAGRPFGSNAQILTNPFGKILRINSDGTIPNDNPYFRGTRGINQSIWAIGLRNPFTFAFQPGTGMFYINDVGADTWEEINEGVRGGNYGWPDFEGPSQDPRYKSPIYAYGHGKLPNDQAGCAISGGTFYNPQNSPYPKAYVGKYFFIDYCNNWMRVLDPKDHSVADFGKDLASNPVTLEVGPDGNLYYMSRWFRAIYRITYKTPSSGL